MQVQESRDMFETNLGAIAVSRATGASLRQLQWWEETGLLRAGRKGRARTYDASLVLTIAAVRQLHIRGLSTQKTRSIIRQLEAGIKAALPTLHQNSVVYLATDGQRALTVATAQNIAEFAASHNRVVAVISLTRLYNRVISNLDRVNRLRRN